MRYRAFRISPVRDRLSFSPFMLLDTATTYPGLSLRARRALSHRGAKKVLLALLAFRVTRVGGGSRTTTNVDRGLGMLNRPHEPSRVLQRASGGDETPETRNLKPGTRLR